jgi:hypothetical protein
MTGGQRAAWKAALAAHHKRQRQQRGRRGKQLLTRYQPGMMRIDASTPADTDGVTTTLPRCPFPGCPVRYRGGPNRECPEHQNETIAAAAELGIDLTRMDTPPGDSGERTAP